MPDSGLWRYTPHPDYFGEACFRRGLFLIAAGAALLEERMKKKPDHAAYAARTPVFIPWFPKRGWRRISVWLLRCSTPRQRG